MKKLQSALHGFRIVRYGRKLARRVRGLVGRVVFGGNARRRLLIALLLRNYRSQFRRDWLASDHPPHFTDFDYISLEVAFGKFNPGGFNRAFLTAELLREGDRLLDIGCGDGFADRRFYSEKCSSIDAIDIEPEAIAHARRRNPADNIRYHLADAVQTPFPAAPYDVIVWDGAIGHFPPDTTERMLVKIREALTPDGVFTGSESLGRQEGAYDHLRFFDDLNDLASMLRETFPFVQTRAMTYPISGGIVRREGYWRCALREERLASPWHQSA